MNPNENAVEFLAIPKVKSVIQARTLLNLTEEGLVSQFVGSERMYITLYDLAIEKRIVSYFSDQTSY